MRRARFMLAVLLAPLSAMADASSPAGDHVWASCAEHVPSGVAKPRLVERFAARGLSGYALPLELTLEHGKGEVVLPDGLRVQSGGDAARALTEAGFYLPDPDGGAGPRVVRTDLDATRSRTDVTISVVALPKTPGRQTMTLPPLPIAVARASGDVVTLCTAPHAIRIEDPTSSVADPTPHPNPASRVQREEWVLARQITVAALIAAAAAALLTWLVMKWLRRPRPAKPPPPPRPPWEVAWEELRAVRFAGLVPQGRYAEHFDRVSDALRKYLGGLYGFDGLETTTFEMELVLRSITPRIPELETIGQFLERCDLVKFARYAPSEDDCAHALDEAERLVSATMPAPRAATGAG
jgi:hypothetical protein